MASRIVTIKSGVPCGGWMVGFFLRGGDRVKVIEMTRGHFVVTLSFEEQQALSEWTQTGELSREQALEKLLTEKLFYNDNGV